VRSPHAVQTRGLDLAGWYGVSGLESAGVGIFCPFFLVHTYASISILWHIDAISGQAPWTSSLFNTHGKCAKLLGCGKQEDGNFMHSILGYCDISR
jgi:hypothetical protein